MTTPQGGSYEFHVGRQLSPAAVTAFPGFSVTHTPTGSVLFGHVCSDAQLRSIITRLGQLELAILDVRRLPDRPIAVPAGADGDHGDPRSTGDSWP